MKQKVKSLSRLIEVVVLFGGVFIFFGYLNPPIPAIKSIIEQGYVAVNIECVSANNSLSK